MTFDDKGLAGEFPPAGEDQWRKAVDRALKGGAFEKLIAKTYDGGKIDPLYSPARAPGPRALRRKPGRWAVLARVDLADAEKANAQALEDLEGGADGLQLVFRGALGAYGTALGGDDEAALTQLLDKVRIDWGLPITLEDSPLAPRAPEALAKLVESLHIEPSITQVLFGLDPLGAALRFGFGNETFASQAKRFGEKAKRFASLGYKQGVVAADARLVHAAGGTEAQELGYALAAGVAYLRALSEAGLGLDEARRLILFRLAVDADEFASVAKLRALRRLWAKVEESCGLTPEPALIHAETAWRMMSASDPWSNLLRVTVAVFSAAVGGADAVAALPFTQALGAPDAFARRLARDTQLVLHDESYLDVVDDPTAGAGGFEALTEALAERGWDAFRKIEAEGGLPKALELGRFQSEVAEIAKGRAAAVARAKEKITGSNEFPDIAEKPLSVLAPFDPSAAGEAAPGAKTLSPARLSEPFEALRRCSDAHLAKAGTRPRVFLATLGPVAAFTARANFAKNFFEAGGVEAVFGPMTDDTSEIVAAFRASGAKLACLCSSDAIYCDAAKPAALALRGAGATLYLAGRPGDLEAELRQAGVERFIFLGCDMLPMLQRAIEEAL
jgi:methylmalonyl-CoA mutase